jgi:hypothetical protein
MGPYELLKIIVEILDRLGISYLVTGSVAAMAYGEPRLTNDIDIVAAVENNHVDGLLAAFPSEQFYISDESLREAIRYQKQFNIIHPASGLKIDVFIREKTPFNDSRFNRIRRIKAGESLEANFAAPEDIIIMKMNYYKEGGSEKHLRDISGIMKISGAEIDSAYIALWAQKLNLSEIWDLIVKKLDESAWPVNRGKPGV